MSTLEIPRAEWEARLNAFVQAHQGWLISLDVFNPRIEASAAIDEMPLLAISVDDLPNNCRITISVARSSAEYASHVINRVTRLSIHQSEGAEAGLQIESADGLRTALRFRVAVSPERVDHVLHT